MHSGFTVHKGLVYGRAGDRELALDLYLPNNPLRPVPVIVYIHGGGWSALDKSWCPYPMRLLEQEYAVASVDYRLVQEGGSFPNNLYDCKAAIRWVRAHATDYGLDGSHIGVWGDSAGGHLAALVALTGDKPELEGNVGTPGISSKVQAGCLYFGALDLETLLRTNKDDAWLERLLCGLIGVKSLAGNLERLRAASPVTYASKDAPPLLVLHGDKDTQVPLSQSVMFYEALWKVGADVRLHVVHGGDHLSFYRSPADIPWHAAQIVEMEDAFFYRTLKAHERALAEAVS